MHDKRYLSNLSKKMTLVISVVKLQNKKPQISSEIKD